MRVRTSMSYSPTLFLRQPASAFPLCCSRVTLRTLTSSVRSLSTFVLSHPDHGSDLSVILPPPLIALVRLLILSEADFKSARSKGKLPKGNLKRVDVKENKEVLEVLDKVLKQREGMYVGGSVEVRFYFISPPN